MKEKNLNIENKFFDIISLFLSFLVSIYRGFFIFFSKQIKKENLFFDLFDFLFIIWPKYFWNKANLYKLFSFPSDLIKYIFYKK